MAFQDNLYLGGGSPWEVPFAQLFGARSFETLGKIVNVLLCTFCFLVYLRGYSWYSYLDIYTDILLNCM